MLRAILLTTPILISLVQPAGAHPLDHGLAIVDPEVIELLDRDFGVAQILARRPPGEVMTNDRLFDAKSKIGMHQVAAYIFKQIKDYSHHNADKDDPQVLDERFVVGRIARFQLAGVVNRMDRGFIPEVKKHCGETRLIYRLFYQGQATVSGVTGEVQSRLPMTLNVVLKADTGDGCAAVAKRWLNPPPEAATTDAKAAYYKSQGALRGVSASQIERLEFNYQVKRLPASTVKDFGGRADYLLSVFRWSKKDNVFAQVPLENQIDPARYLNSDAERKALNDALMTMEFIRDVDNGRPIILEKFTTKDAISVSPGGQVRTRNRPFDDLLDKVRYEAVIEQFKAKKQHLLSIKSFEGFVARLNDLSCAGCHQTRAIAGFHFPGADWKNAPKINSVFVAGSPHFYGDLPRRRMIVEAYAKGAAPNFRREYSARPAHWTLPTFAGTQIADGWGAVCYKAPDGTPPDPTFLPISNCAAPLQCEVITRSERHDGMGMCLPPEDAIQVGDPLEVTSVSYKAGFDKDRLSAPEQERAPKVGDLPHLETKSTYIRAHQRGILSFGGFPGGMLRLRQCSGQLGQQAANNEPQSICVQMAGDGFNDCIKAKPFPQCFVSNVSPGGPRSCDVSNPCREDYICTTTTQPGKGACIPPYFVFQFRVDRHPSDIKP